MVQYLEKVKKLQKEWWTALEGNESHHRRLEDLFAKYGIPETETETEIETETEVVLPFTFPKKVQDVQECNSVDEAKSTGESDCEGESAKKNAQEEDRVAESDRGSQRSRSKEVSSNSAHGIDPMPKESQRSKSAQRVGNHQKESLKVQKSAQGVGNQPKESPRLVSSNSAHKFDQHSKGNPFQKSAQGVDQHHKEESLTDQKLVPKLFQLKKPSQRQEGSLAES